MSDVTEKWGEAIANRGFAQIPNYLLLLNQFLDPDRRLSPVEMLVVLQLTGAWWKKKEMPFPSMATLAARCGVSDRQIQRAINELVKRDIIGRVKRRSETGVRSNNAYDLSPLIVLLNQVATAFPNGFPRNIQRRKDTPTVNLGPMPQHIKDMMLHLREVTLDDNLEDIGIPEA